MKRIYKSEQSGRSMVEMLGVLAIIGVLSVAGIAGYSKAMAKFKVSKTLDQVSMLVANIRTLYAGQRDYAGLTQQVAINLGIIPEDMITDAARTTVGNAFNGTVVITAAGANSEAFTVSYTGLSQEACAALLTADWGSGSNTGLLRISMAASAGVAALPTAAANSVWDQSTLPVTPVSASTACGGATAAARNSKIITWYYF